jgi:fructose-1,6-bisphosphatase/sedoheptulose 1,7-bisphosphatase-like protein
MRANQQPYDDLERIIEFDFLRATEAPALNMLPWIGRGKKKKLSTKIIEKLKEVAWIGHCQRIGS